MLKLQQFKLAVQCQFLGHIKCSALCRVFVVAIVVAVVVAVLVVTVGGGGDVGGVGRGVQQHAGR